LIATFVGLDYAGKSSIRIYLESFDIEKAMKTMTSRKVEQFKRGRLNIFVIPGQKLFRYEEKFYRKLFPITEVVIFVVDAADRDRFDEVKEYFDYVMNMIKKYAKEDCRLLVLAHKQDLPNAAKAKEIAELLGVREKQVLETSIYQIGTIYRLLLKLHGTDTTPFDGIAYELAQKTKAETVIIADKNMFPYTTLGNEELAMNKLRAFIEFLNISGDCDVLISLYKKMKTFFVKNYIGKDEVFVIVVNSKADSKTILDAVKEAFKRIAEEYQKRWGPIR